MTPGEALFLCGAAVGFLGALLVGLISLAIFEWRHALAESARFDEALSRAARRGDS
jgi:hypothetical protein